MNSSHNESSIDCNSPVTIIVKRRPKADKIEEFEQIMQGTTRDAMTFQGHLGANIIRPTRPGDFYRIVFKFDSMRNYLAWENSEVREQWMQRYAEVEQGEQEMEILSGLETWFTLSEGEALVPPPRHKMLILTWVSIFLLSTLLQYFVRPWISELHLLGQIAIMTFIMVALMTYFVMPQMSRLFKRWLYCDK